MASKWLGRGTTTHAPKVLQRRRHSTPVSIVEEADHVAQGVRNEQRESQAQMPRPGRRKSLLSRGRLLRPVKSLSDLVTANRKVDKSKDQQESLHVETPNRPRKGLLCTVVRMTSVNSASSAPLYFFGGAE